MAQLKNTVVQGSLKVTDNIYSNTAQFSILNALTGASASTYGMGTDGQVLKSNGTNIYWSTETYTNVTQSPTTNTNADNKAFELLFSFTDDNTEHTESTKKTDSLTYNPKTKALTIGTTNESSVFVPGTINGIKFNTYSSTSLATNGWEKIGGLTEEHKIMLVKANGANETYAPNWMTNRYSTLLFFSYSDTQGFLQCDYSTPMISFGAGSTGNSTAASPKWYMKLAGTSGKTYTFPEDSTTLAASDGSNATGTWDISVLGSNLSGTVPIANGGTNATTALDAITNLGSVYWGVENHDSITKLRNENLDEYGTVSNDDNQMGTYIVANSSASNTITHTPFLGSGYKLFVLRGYVSNITVQFAINNSPSPFLRILNTNDMNNSPSWVRFPYIKQSSEGAFSSVGSSTVPVYADSSGEITACSYISLDHGGTGAITVSGARANLNLRAEDNSSSTLYLMGSVSQLNDANTYTNGSVYMKGGELSAATLGVNYGTATTKIKLQWNNTENSLDFVFV